MGALTFSLPSIKARQQYVDDGFWYPLALVTAGVGGGTSIVAPVWVAFCAVLAADAVYLWVRRRSVDVMRQRWRDRNAEPASGPASKSRG
jgi:hypothetical protein